MGDINSVLLKIDGLRMELLKYPCGEAPRGLLLKLAVLAKERSDLLRPVFPPWPARVVRKGIAKAKNICNT